MTPNPYEEVALKVKSDCIVDADWDGIQELTHKPILEALLQAHKAGMVEMREKASKTANKWKSETNFAEDIVKAIQEIKIE